MWVTATGIMGMQTCQWSHDSDDWKHFKLPTLNLRKPLHSLLPPHSWVSHSPKDYEVLGPILFPLPSLFFFFFLDFACRPVDKGMSTLWKQLQTSAKFHPAVSARTSVSAEVVQTGALCQPGQLLAKSSWNFRCGPQAPRPSLHTASALSIRNLWTLLWYCMNSFCGLFHPSTFNRP